MDSTELVLSPAALDDLNNIYTYGFHNWGNHQSKKYIDELQSYIWKLVQQPQIGVVRDDIFHDIRSFPANSHLIFYRLKANQVQIARILHGRQDPQKHFNIT